MLQLSDMRAPVAVLLSAVFCAGFLWSEDKKSLEVIGQIKGEAFARSQVMDTLAGLTDLNGPRLTASPEFKQAADWAMARLKEYGISNVHAEAWGPFGRSWSLQKYELEETSPRYSHLVAAPLAWSSPTHGEKTGDAIYAPIHLPPSRYDVNKSFEAFKQYESEWKGKLKGKIVLTTEMKTPPPSTQPNFSRYTDAELAELAKAPEPHLERNIPIEELKIPSEPDEARKYLMSLPSSTLDAFFDRFDALNDEQARFFHEEGVLGVIHADSRAHNGLLFGEAAGPHKAKSPAAPPTFIVTEEQYSRMGRLLEAKHPVTLRMNLEVNMGDRDVDGMNLIGEIPGGKKPDEIVMVGAHFDSWHTGTGATDNGAGSAVMIEVMRILKTLNVKLDRTVRIGLWSGEEQGLYGSKAYVKQHFGDPETMQLKPEHAKLDAYLNLDNGSGKIRGVYLQGNDAARPLFSEWMQPYHDMGASTMSLHNTGGTDHLSFDAVGLPGFQFIQDRLDYSTVTHHSDMDTYSHAIPEDLMQASAVIATMVYDIANQDEMFPRKPLPVAPKKTAPSSSAQ